MKNKLILSITIITLSLFNAHSAQAQGMAVNAAGTTADTSAMLDVNSTTKGMLVPRMTNTQVTNIHLPANGLMVYQTDGTPGFYYNSGTAAAPVWTGITAQGNTFNGNSQLIQTTSTGKLPLLDGSALTNLNGANLTANSVTVGKLPTGATPTTFLRGDGTWVTPGGSTSAFTTTITFQNPGIEVANTVYFLSPANAYNSANGNITIADHATISASSSTPNYILISTACTAVALKLGVNNTATPTNTINTVTLYVNGAPTAMTTNVTTNGTKAVSADVTHTVALSVGDIVSIGWSDNANAGFNGITIQLVCQ